MRTVAEVMTVDVRTVDEAAVVGSLRDLMLDASLHGVPVLGKDGALVGIVTSTDLVEEWDPAMGVSTVMTADVHTVSLHASVVDAAREMLDRRVHHLVVMSGADIVGLVSSFDLLKALAGTVEDYGSRQVTGRAAAAPGDLIVIRGRSVGRVERRGVIVEARGPDGSPPYVVNWLDDPHRDPHDVLFFPGADAAVEPPTQEPGAGTGANNGDAAVAQ